MKSTGNAFTGATNSLQWKSNSIGDSGKGGRVTAAKNGTPIYLPNSRQQQAYSAAGYPKTRCEHLGVCQSKK